MNQTTPLIEPLESRQMLSATVHRYVIGFYGYAFGTPVGSGFGNEWTRNVVNDAAAKGAGTAKLFAEETGRATAEKYLLAAIDHNHDKTLSVSEIRATRLRVVGYSLGGVEGANFTRDLTSKTLRGYKLAIAVPVETFVTLDPVNYPINFDPLKHTDGPSSNVHQFFNFYEGGASKGKSSIALFDHSTGASQGSTSYDDTGIPIVGILHGGKLDSQAATTAQYQVDAGTFANHPIRHSLGGGVDGQLTGRQTNHGTLPFYAYPYALADLVK